MIWSQAQSNIEATAMPKKKNKWKCCQHLNYNFFGLSNVLTVMQLLLSININCTLVILWSLFRYFTNIGFVIFTARENLLTEHTLQWNRRKVERLPQSLAKRYKKVWNDNFKFRNIEIIICLVVAKVGSRI